MPLEDICALEIRAADDAVLFMWVTVPHLKNAFDVLLAWGFTYKSNLVWVKDRIGTGYWARNKHEHLLIATRGNIPAPLMGTQCASIIEAAVGAHSVKPEDFRAIIDGYYPGVQKLELFARRALPDGWDRWGNEAGVTHPSAAT